MIKQNGSIFMHVGQNGQSKQIDLKSAMEIALVDLKKNFKYETGPNRVVNNDEVVRLSRLLFAHAEECDDIFLTEAMCQLYELVGVYDSNYEVNNVYPVTQVAVKMTKILLIDRKCSNLILIPFITFRDRLFEIYLVDNMYYRKMAAAFYSVMKIEPWAGKFGFFDCRWIYDLDKAIGTLNAIDADYIIIPDILARISLSLSEDGCQSGYENQISTLVELSKRCWEIIAHDISHVVFTWRNKSKTLIKDSLKREDISADGFLDTQWVGLAYFLAITHRNYRKQVSIAKYVGCPNLNNLKDVRKANPILMFTILGAIILFGYVGIMLLKDRHIILFLIEIVGLYGLWNYVSLSPSQRRKLDRKMDEEAMLSNITTAVEFGHGYISPYMLYSSEIMENYFSAHPEQRWLLY